MGVKQKFSSMDVAAMVTVLKQRVRRNQVANVYDLAGSKSFLLRLKNRDKTSKGSGTEFANVILEPAARFHLTKFDREKNSVPSSATMKLRKHLRNLRLADVEQVGLDRVVIFTFEGGGGGPGGGGPGGGGHEDGGPGGGGHEEGDHAHTPGIRLHLVLELFVRGSLVLLNDKMEVLFRSVTYEYATNHVPVGSVYKFEQPAMLHLVNPKIAIQLQPDEIQLKDVLGATIGIEAAPSTSRSSCCTTPCPEKLAAFCASILEKERREQEDSTTLGDENGAGDDVGLEADTTAVVAGAQRGNKKVGAFNATAKMNKRNIKQKNKKARSGGVKLENVLLQCLYCVHPTLVAYGLREAGFDPTRALREEALLYHASSIQQQQQGQEEHNTSGVLSEGPRQPAPGGEGDPTDRSAENKSLSVLGVKLAKAINICLDTMRLVCRGNAEGSTTATGGGGLATARRKLCRLTPPARSTVLTTAEGEEPLKGYILVKKQHQLLSGSSTTSTTSANNNKITKDEESTTDRTFEDFSPLEFLLNRGAATAKGQKGQDYLEFDDFSTCVDQFFSQLEIQKIREAKQQKTTKVLSKVERIKLDHEERIRKMECIQKDADLKALLLEENLELVDACIAMLNARGRIEWKALWQEIKLQQTLGHPLAQHIHSLQLEKNQFTIMLEDSITSLMDDNEGNGENGEDGSSSTSGDDEDSLFDELFSDTEDAGGSASCTRIAKSTGASSCSTTTATASTTGVSCSNQVQVKSNKKNKRGSRATVTRQDLPMVTLTIDLSLSAYGNVSKLHSQRKATKSKTEKTILQSDRVVKQANKKAQQDVKKIDRDYKVHNLRQVRQLTWFESKFSWFFSSEGFLCVQGRDATTQDLLIKRYMDPDEGDVVVGSESDGALLVVVKMNKTKLLSSVSVPSTSSSSSTALEIPPLTLQEAATMCLSTSAAWSKKDVVGAWWVKGEQIVIESWEIEGKRLLYYPVRGEKHLLPPSRLEMGYCLLFEVSPECGKRHIGERKIRSGELAEQGSAPPDGDEVEKNVPGEQGDDVEAKDDEDGDDQGRDETSRDDEEDREEDSNVDEEDEEDLLKDEDAKNFSSRLETVAAKVEQEEERLLPPHNSSCTSSSTSPPSRRHLQTVTILSGLGEEDERDNHLNYSFVPAERIVGEGHKKKMTRKERELAKKGQEQQSSPEDEQVLVGTTSQMKFVLQQGSQAETQAQTTILTDASSPPSSASSSKINKNAKNITSSADHTQQPQQIPRGQKAKLKKLAKYADQDEEERALRMQLMGAKDTKYDSRSKKAGGNIREDNDYDEKVDSKNYSTTNYTKGSKQGKGRANDGGGPAAGRGADKGIISSKGGKGRGGEASIANSGKKGKQGTSTSSASTREQDRNQVIKTREQLLQERQGIQESIKAANLPDWDTKFTGRPFGNDEIVRAVPMCAPFSAVRNCYFKVKLLPGTGMKKGRVNQLAQGLFFGEQNTVEVCQLLNRGEVDEQREVNHRTTTLEKWRQYMNAIPDMEVMNVLISNAQIQAANLQKIQKQMKKEKQTKAKEGGGQQPGGGKSKKK
ncbi:unnamed protein product [Amoebophrya sp. A25]|nr:unnamed protein product [Amoebophrya sp. A25]|eukprot:GSA25T00023999001.1